MTDETTTDGKTLTIQGLQFVAPARYAEGHVLTLSEARQLQQTYHEALRNNFASQVKKALKEADAEETSALSESAIDDLTSRFATYAEEFEFAQRSGVTRTPVDPIEREAIKIAKPLILDALKKKNIDPKSLEEGVLDQLIASAIAKRPDITEEATRRVTAAKNLAAMAIE